MTRLLMIPLIWLLQCAAALAIDLARVQQIILRLIAVTAIFWCAFFWGGAADAQTLTNKGTAVDNSGSGSSLAVTSVSVTAPAMIIVGVYEDVSGGGGVCSSSASVKDGMNTYTLLTHVQPSGNKVDGDLCVYYFNYPSVGLTSATITYTYNTGGDDATMSVTAITGYSGTAPDNAVTNTARGSNMGPASVTSGMPSVSGETFLGFSMTTAFTFTQASGWTTPPNTMSSTTGNPNSAFQSGHLVGSGASTQTYAPTLVGVQSWGSIILGIKPPSSALCTIAAMGAGPC